MKSSYTQTNLAKEVEKAFINKIANVQDLNQESLVQNTLDNLNKAANLLEELGKLKEAELITSILEKIASK